MIYKRMLNKNKVPTIQEMIDYCGIASKLFTKINEWLTNNYTTEQKIVFPYGNNYGWGVSHRIKNKLVCHVFPENDAFIVMVRLSNSQYNSVYEDLQDYTKKYIDNKYPCSDGGWIHYRVTNEENIEDIKTLLSIKCAK